MARIDDGHHSFKRGPNDIGQDSELRNERLMGYGKFMARSKRK